MTPARADLAGGNENHSQSTNNRTAYLRLSETLTTSLTRLRSSAQTLDSAERQRIVRLLAKEVLVSLDEESHMSREVHVRFYKNVAVRFRCATYSTGV